jgi:uncharacterized protein involved in type VI secretion and phage assembly
MTPAHAAREHVRDRFYGLFPATVTKLAGDPDSAGRIEVGLDWLPRSDGGGPVTAWATMITPYADAGQGFAMLPEIGSTVVVGFEAGYPDHPYVVGAVWNGRAAPPETPTDANDLRLIRTRAGSRLEFDDTTGAVAVRLSAAGAGAGVHRIELDDGGNSLTISSAAGATITLDAAGGVVIDAAATVEVKAAMVTVDAPVSQFNGMITCDTLISKGGGVVSPAYTTGAGNIL